jgi:hypothetical protein
MRSATCTPPPAAGGSIIYREAPDDRGDALAASGGSANAIAFPVRIGDVHVADAVRVGLDRFVLDALGCEALEERVEPGDGEGDASRAAFGSMKSQAC